MLSAERISDTITKMAEHTGHDEQLCMAIYLAHDKVFRAEVTLPPGYREPKTKKEFQALLRNHKREDFTSVEKLKDHILDHLRSIHHLEDTNGMIKPDGDSDFYVHDRGLKKVFGFTHAKQKSRHGDIYKIQITDNND